ncbi:hypothetical protein TraAM80_04323 [Trypanosoma rangeli]|uniref:CCDC81 HU domain-containing protein n=1 Tax=Trypanosoma rangeli TaxID=5698 RepID=A0A3R7RK51_TRYRA|nr:uncharacterized protein TraAM80_04323 [Trypanosoma rangeli]RNF05790.1 hypothetical protein TraAM80_04323 [Trypanosoma rangeli]|eukprot:RNF05790.1 hypothetical protein TraAM80_04323 [Trypanosoma rangeli]
MLSAHGAIVNELVMMECTSSQDQRANDIFLLSELERVWSALSMVVRQHLLEGHNVRVVNFGSFWLETRPLVSDGIERYYARRIHFGVDSNFALRYNIDSNKVPQEPSRLSYVKASMAEVVGIAAVPARTATMALREFFSYVGEGLFRQKVFKLTFEGVATLLIKREKSMLDVDPSLRRDIFAIDSRKWPLSVREAAASVVMDTGRPATASSVSSRPSTAQLGRQSAASRPIEPRPAFVSSAPRDRLFSEIEKEPPRRLPPRAALSVDEPSWGSDNAADAYVKESIFDAIDPEECPTDEPDIEMVEEVPRELPTLHAYEEEAPKAVVKIGRHSFHDHSSVRDLLYGKAVAQVEPITRGRRRYINRDSDAVTALLKIT